MHPLVGADPEVFLKRDDHIVSAIGLVGGSKEHPMPCLKGALQEDNVLAEFNIDPAKTEEEFIDNIKTVMQELVNKVTPCVIEVKPSHVFELEDLIAGGPQAMMSGCDPDFDCWTLKQNSIKPYTSGLRAGGGHIHVGLDGIAPHLIARVMDLRVGAASVQYDNDLERRKLYGKSGAYRPKAYGAEYRSLSNAWLKTDNTMRWVYNATIEAVKHISTIREDVARIGGLTVLRKCINTGDVELSKRICKILDVVTV